MLVKHRQVILFIFCIIIIIWGGGGGYYNNYEIPLNKAAKVLLRLSSAVPKIQWDSNPHCPYG